ncbi:Glyceraldehyde-3-phosphate dehydrogenase [Heterocephalus glaber]|uniref:glyceraldehyde-3-phosphate dehydrogenase (phosphorylating) n=1 Tax=Heterocephalus glaber TaxID=10181 RepID=G5AR35_HETGA|nr:Glyceraldehyde-3-phosphate dehydrogenase [Heterocephalus glaber]
MAGNVSWVNVFSRGNGIHCVKSDRCIFSFSASVSLIYDDEGQMKRFGHSGCLVTRVAFNFSNVDIVLINDLFLDLNHMFYMFQYNFTHLKFNGTVKAENRKTHLHFNPSGATYHHKVGDAVAEHVESTDVLIPMKKAKWPLLHLNGEAQRVLISALSAEVLVFVVDMNHEKHHDSSG